MCQRASRRAGRTRLIRAAGPGGSTVLEGGPGKPCHRSGLPSSGSSRSRATRGSFVHSALSHFGRA